MGASSADEDESFVIYGTPLQQEEESRAGQRRKEIKDPALTRQLPLHQQVDCLLLQARWPSAAHAVALLLGTSRTWPCRR